MPIYIFGSFSLRCSDLDEDKAQNKMAFGLALGLVTYVALFFFAWGFLYLTWFGAPLAVGIVWLFMVYHNTMIDDNCKSQAVDLSEGQDSLIFPEICWLIPSSLFCDR